jgi:hypothetical protein
VNHSVRSRQLQLFRGSYPTRLGKALPAIRCRLDIA